jgi:chromate transport protein ChrA
MSTPRWYQFTVRRMLGLTVAVAALFALLWSFPIPDVLRVIVASFYLFIIFWEFIRRPVRRAEHEEWEARRAALVASRETLEKEVEERRRTKRETSDPSDSDTPRA